MIKKNSIAYFRDTSGSYAPLKAAHTFRKKKEKIALLWGDPLYVIDINGQEATVSGKGHHIRLPVAKLMENALLSVYQIDCGQGDSALVHFPDDRWMMIDGGPPHDWSNSGKIAADFLYWKMFVDQSWKDEFDFQTGPFKIDALVCTHPDYDHYGGFMDMTSKVKSGVLEYGVVYHNGMGRFSGTKSEYRNGSGFSQLGPVEGGTLPDAFLTTLLGGFGDVTKYSKDEPNRSWVLTGSHGEWLQALKELHGKGVGNLVRLHHGFGHLPGYLPGAQPFSVKVLGPVQEMFNGKPALRYLDTANIKSMSGPSLTRNGHSIVLRIDYGDVRILMTGDLNFKSHALLLKHVPHGEFACHVAKACHHGAEDVSSTFLQKMAPLATMFSSGDNESYAHPRAKVLGLAGALGQVRHRGMKKYLDLEEKRCVAPLIYSTELSRSIELFPPKAVFDKDSVAVSGPEIQAKGRTKNAQGRRSPLKDWLLADRMVYGMINVRTDGEKIVMGVMRESEASFQTETLFP